MDSRETTRDWDVIVIGAGASGLMAAGQAAASGARVLLLEKMDRPARKLRISGKGRCNLTNTVELPQFIARYAAGGDFLRQAFARFFAPDLVAFMDEIGVRTVVDRGGRVFPAADDANVVVAALLRWCEKNGVTLRLGQKVSGLHIESGAIKGVGVGDHDEVSRVVVIATGGASYPATGSSGDGYRLAEEAGHTIVPVRPSLVPLEVVGDIGKQTGWLELRNVGARLLVDGQVAGDEFGDIGLADFGITGPLVLRFSRQAVDALHAGSRVEISIDLKPALDEDKLDARLQRDFAAHGKQAMATILAALLPRKLIQVCLASTGIPRERRGHEVTANERRTLRAWLKDFRLAIRGHRSWNEAIITAGGVETREVDPRTMASRLVTGLYFCGEVLDIDADTGGFNLQAAFSTGWLAGRSAAQKTL